ncbi:MAG: TolC family protein [Clostridia bacterium]|nr:TolC family protein [Clostridia bacterium]MBN2882100.1 TolC family protein [Clostridia bacterium]
MKKLTILLLAAAIVILPFSSLYGEELTLFERYKENDISLSDLTEKYEKLVEEREEKLDSFENYRISRKSTFDSALGYASKENGILQVDWDIQNALYNLKSREAWLETSFRNTYLSLYKKVRSADQAYQSAGESLELYNETVSNNKKGYASDIEMLEAKYSYKKADNVYMASLRSLDSSFRSFQSLLGGALDFNDMSFDFTEPAGTPATLNEYISKALENSSSLSLVIQSITRYENELKYLDKYVISYNLSYYREKRESIETNLAILKLTLEKNKQDLIKDIEDRYNALILEKEKIGLLALSLEIAETDYEVNKDLYKRKLIDYSELIGSENSVKAATVDYQLAVYGFNTMLMELEYASSCFMSEDK